MYQKLLLIFYIVFLGFILYMSLFKKIEHLSVFTNSNQDSVKTKTYDDYLFDYNSKKIITIQLKNANMYDIDSIKLIQLLAHVMNITKKRINIIHIDQELSHVIFIIKKVNNINESNINQAIELLEKNIKDPNSLLMKGFHISSININIKYVTSKKYYSDWWSELKKEYLTDTQIKK